MYTPVIGDGYNWITSLRSIQGNASNRVRLVRLMISNIFR